MIFTTILRELLSYATPMKNIYFTILTIILLLADIVSKYIAEQYLSQSIPLIWNLLSFQLVHNTGIAFSIGIPPLFLKILTLVLIFGIFYYYFFSGKEKRTFLKDMAVSFILAGAIGNGIERVFHGYVVDFISLKYFAVFNIADIWISIGAYLILFLIYRKEITL